MRIFRGLALGASMLALISACSTGGGGNSAPATAASASTAASNPTIRLGSDGFYEAKLMAEIYGQALEANGYKVDRTAIGIGARKVSAPALESGQFDLKPEYIGSGLAFYEPGKQTGDPKANQTELQNVLKTKGGGITVLDYSPAADQNAFVVRKETADQFKLTKMSDLTILLRTPTGDRQRALAPLGTLYEDACAVFLDGVVADLMRLKTATEESMRARHATLE